MPSIPGESALRFLASLHQSVTKDLKDVVCKEIMKVGVEMSDRSIEDCHQVGKSPRPFLSFPKGRWQSKF